MTSLERWARELPEFPPGWPPWLKWSVQVLAWAVGIAAGLVVLALMIVGCLLLAVFGVFFLWAVG